MNIHPDNIIVRLVGNIFDIDEWRIDIYNGVVIINIFDYIDAEYIKEITGGKMTKRTKDIYTITFPIKNIFDSRI
jgi:hypothetical protein